MKESIIKAEVAIVDLGYAKVEGLRLPDGSYEIAVPQLLTVFFDFKTHKNYLSQDIKRLMGAGFKTHKRKTEFNKNNTNTIALCDLPRIALALYKKHNLPSAEALLEAALVEALERRFDRAFEVKRTEEERDARLEMSFKRVLARRAWTDVIKQRHIDLYGCEPSPDVYRDLTVKVNLALFGQAHFKCDRSLMTADQQRKIESFENFAARWSDKYPDASPESIIAETLTFF